MAQVFSPSPDTSILLADIINEKWTSFPRKEAYLGQAIDCKFFTLIFLKMHQIFLCQYIIYQMERG